MIAEDYDEAIRSTMAELTGKFAAATPIEDTLARVTAAAVDLIRGVDCADVLLIQNGEYRSTAQTSDVAPAVDREQLRNGGGPCLYTHQANTGALNLFGFAAQGFDNESEAIAAMLATHAAVALIVENRQHQFESALASRDVIGQAKGIVMERFEIDAVRAFELLSRMSQNANTPVRVIAEEIIAHSRR